MLSEEQRKIVEKIDGKVLVVACPGSGKTTTMLERIHYMVSEKKWILCGSLWLHSPKTQLMKCPKDSTKNILRMARFVSQPFILFASAF